MKPFGSKAENKILIPTVSIKNLSHYFGKGIMRKQILYAINMTISQGEVVILTGPSGCGKTTLLTLIGALRQVQDGEITVFGNHLQNSSRRVRQRLRQNIGMIFQGHNLIKCLTSEQNVQMGADLMPGLSYMARRNHSRALLRTVGLEDQMDKLPHDLSGGQKQRVAVARALACNPKLLLADEPTSSLDSITGREIVLLLKKLAVEQACSVLMVTHDPRILDVADRIINMEDGRLIPTIS